MPPKKKKAKEGAKPLKRAYSAPYKGPPSARRFGLFGPQVVATGAPDKTNRTNLDPNYVGLFGSGDKLPQAYPKNQLSCPV